MIKEISLSNVSIIVQHQPPPKVSYNFSTFIYAKYGNNWQEYQDSLNGNYYLNDFHKKSNPQPSPVPYYYSTSFYYILIQFHHYQPSIRTSLSYNYYVQAPCHQTHEAIRQPYYSISSISIRHMSNKYQRISDLH